MLWPARPAVHQSGLVAQELLREAAGWAAVWQAGQSEVKGLQQEHGPGSQQRCRAVDAVYHPQDFLLFIF